LPVSCLYVLTNQRRGRPALTDFLFIIMAWIFRPPLRILAATPRRPSLPLAYPKDRPGRNRSSLFI